MFNAIHNQVVYSVVFLCVVKKHNHKKIFATILNFKQF